MVLQCLLLGGEPGLQSLVLGSQRSMPGMVLGGKMGVPYRFMDCKMGMCRMEFHFYLDLSERSQWRASVPYDRWNRLNE